MDSEIKERARGGFDAFPGKGAGDTNPWGLAFVSGLAFVLGGAAAVSFLAAAVTDPSYSYVVGPVAAAVLIGMVAGIIALVGKCGVSPGWPILGFVTTIVLLVLVAYAACQGETVQTGGYM